MNKTVNFTAIFLSLNAMASAGGPGAISGPVHTVCQGSLGSVDMESVNRHFKYKVVYQGKVISGEVNPIDDGRLYSPGGLTYLSSSEDHPQDYWLSMSGSMSRTVTVPAGTACAPTRTDVCHPIKVPAHQEHSWFSHIGLMLDVVAPGVYQFNSLELTHSTIYSLGPDTICKVFGI